MPHKTATYNLTVSANTKVVTNANGSTTITFEKQVPDDSYDEDDEGKMQNDMLWEGFGHDFEIK